MNIDLTTQIDFYSAQKLSLGEGGRVTSMISLLSSLSIHMAISPHNMVVPFTFPIAGSSSFPSRQKCATHRKSFFGLLTQTVLRTDIWIEIPYNKELII